MTDSSNQRGYGLQHLFLILIVMGLVARCASSPSEPNPSMAESYKNPVPISDELRAQIASGRSSKPARPVEAPRLDFKRPIETDSYAIVCHQGVLLQAKLDRRAEGGVEAIYDAFGSIWGRSEKVKAIGCQEWRGGIKLESVRRMAPPFDLFVEFATEPDGPIMFFTMTPHLRNH